jgi:plasmid replication initiation protein
VTELRALLNVPMGKLERFADFNKYALQPALKELNALSEYAVQVGTMKDGRRVKYLTLLWMQKDLAGRMAALREVERCSVGRKARIEGKVEEPVLPVVAPAQ